MAEILEKDDATRAVPVELTPLSLDARPVEPRPSVLPREEVIDWRTIDPAMIRGDDIPIEELLTYREKLDELLKDASGQFVLIVGREIISLFPDLDSASRYAAEHFGGRKVLIKKIAATEPIHTLEGAVIESGYATGAAIV